MAFSAVFQFRPDDEAGKNRFLLEHYIEHRQFINTLLGATPPFVPVDLPIQRMESIKDWLAAHQEMSQSVWTGLGGGQTTDFGTVNWDSDSQRQDWFNLHQLWHQTVRSSLGL